MNTSRVYQLSCYLNSTVTGICPYPNCLQNALNLISTLHSWALLWPRQRKSRVVHHPFNLLLDWDGPTARAIPAEHPVRVELGQHETVHDHFHRGQPMTCW
jgi:hypothetical protein